MKPAPQIGRIVAQPIADVGSLVANLLTDQVDVAVNLPMDQALGLRESGRFDITLSPPRLGYIYLQFPTAAWSNAKPLADVRVRTAIAKAINRKVLLQSVYGPLAEGLMPTEGLCSKEQLGCDYTKLVPDFDPAGAKKLLADAGYANGFDISISGYRENTPHMTAISGMLREVGIRASVKIHHSTQRLKMIQEGNVEIGYYGWSGGNMFTVSPQIVRHLQAGEYEDSEFVKLVDPIFKTMDDTERRKFAARAFDRLHDMAYTYPMITNREIFVHTKEVAIRAPEDLRPMIISPHEFVWK
jgi:peptide/nickel transport system substrate-binding protein